MKHLSFSNKLQVFLYKTIYDECQYLRRYFFFNFWNNFYFFVEPLPILKAFTCAKIASGRSKVIYSIIILCQGQHDQKESPNHNLLTDFSAQTNWNSRQQCFLSTTCFIETCCISINGIHSWCLVSYLTIDAY